MIHLGDCLDVLPTIPSASVDLILTDPPYYRCIDAEWDNCWPDEASFLAWMGLILEEFRRILKPDGSLYLWTSPQSSWGVEGEIRQRFSVLNRLVWDKSTQAGIHAFTQRHLLKKFFTASEICFFAEQQQLRPRGEVGERRPFFGDKSRPHTDVWRYQVPHHPGRHVCEKPTAMLSDIIRSSSRPGDLVFDAFAGSGSTGEAALSLGRRFIGIERDPVWHDRASRRLSANQGLLF